MQIDPIVSVKPKQQISLDKSKMARRHNASLLSPASILNRGGGWLTTYKEKYANPSRNKYKKHFHLRPPCGDTPKARKVDLTYNREVLEQMSKGNIKKRKRDKAKNTDIKKGQPLMESRGPEHDEYLEGSRAKPKTTAPITRKVKIDEQNALHRSENPREGCKLVKGSHNNKSLVCACDECKLRLMSRINKLPRPKKLQTTYRSDFIDERDSQIHNPSLKPQQTPVDSKMMKVESSYQHEYKNKLPFIEPNQLFSSTINKRPAPKAPFIGLTNYNLAYPRWEIPHVDTLTPDSSVRFNIKFPFTGKSSNKEYGSFGNAARAPPVRFKPLNADIGINSQLKDNSDFISTSRKAFTPINLTNYDSTAINREPAKISNERFAGRFKTTYDDYEDSAVYRKETINARDSQI